MKRFRWLKNKKVIFSLVLSAFLAFGGWALYAYNNRVMPQSAIYFLNDVHSPEAGDKILVFSPHPDDETIGVGGYIYEAEKAGAEVKIVLATDGNKQGLRDQRYAEFKQATEILGVKQSNLVFLGHSDGSLNTVDENSLQQEFQTAIDNFQPNIVFYPYPHDDHPDHAYTGQIVEKMLENSTAISYQFLIHDNYYPRPQRYVPDDYLLPPIKLVTFDKEWQRFLVKPETEVKEKEASEVYKSQLKNPLIKVLFFSTIRKNELFIAIGSNLGGN
ncbi:MAG TPA: PIG-L family deacetylase [Patescibacteria group bacterium]|nr:PIG-L family deacetylase [Patescibacteria group bacterium]